MRLKRLKYFAVLASATLTATTMLGAVGASAAQTSPPFTTIGSITAGAPMNMFNNNGLGWAGLDQMPLAWFKYGTNPNAFWPALATKWQASNNGTVLTVWLRHGVKWSDGVPFTSKDVTTSYALMFAMGWVWYNLVSVQAVGPYEVVFHMAPNIQFNQFENGVLGQNIVPAHIYGQLLPKNIWTVIHEALYTGTNAQLQAQATKANTQLAAIGKQIAAFAPKQDVTTGPFKIVGMNPGEAVLNKVPTFWNAKNIHVNQVIIRNYTSNQQIWNYMIGGQVDNATSAMPTSIKDRAAQTSGNKFYTVPSYFANSLIFDQHVYPYNMVAVRQALAYVINRQNVQQIGEPVSGMNPKYIDGMIDTATRNALTPAQRKNLTLYRYNPAKATQILKDAGFKLVNGQWYLPNGTAWTASIAVNASYTDWVQGVSAVSNEMTTFGIPTKPVLVPPSQFATEQSQGKFPLSFWTIALGPQPFYAYLRLYGKLSGNSETNGKLLYTSQVSNGNWVDFPHHVFLPGFGRVNPGKLTYQLVQSTNPAVIQKDTYELALISNKFVPAITTWDGLLAGFVNTNRFTNYPLNNPEVMLAGVYYPAVGFWMNMGYIRPKS